MISGATAPLSATAVSLPFCATKTPLVALPPVSSPAKATAAEIVDRERRVFAEAGDPLAAGHGIADRGELGDASAGGEEHPLLRAAVQQAREERHVPAPVDRRRHGAALHVEAIEGALGGRWFARGDDGLQHRRCRRQAAGAHARLASAEGRPQHREPEQHQRHQSQGDAPGRASEDRARAGGNHQFLSIPCLSVSMLWRAIFR